MSYFFVEFPLRETFEEISPFVPEYPRLDYHDAVNAGLDYFHCVICFFAPRLQSLDKYTHLSSIITIFD